MIRPAFMETLFLLHYFLMPGRVLSTNAKWSETAARHAAERNGPENVSAFKFSTIANGARGAGVAKAKDSSGSHD